MLDIATKVWALRELGNSSQTLQVYPKRDRREQSLL